MKHKLTKQPRYSEGLNFIMFPVMPLVRAKNKEDKKYAPILQAIVEKEEEYLNIKATN